MCCAIFINIKHSLIEASDNLIDASTDIYNELKGESGLNVTVGTINALNKNHKN